MDGREDSRHLDTAQDPRPGPPYRPDRQTELRTERLRLRPADKEHDLAAVVLACADPDVARFVHFIPQPFASAEADWFFGLASAGWAGGDPMKIFSIFDLLTDRFLGCAGVELREGGEVGYMLGPDARGRGFMTETVRALVSWAHTTAGIRHLFLITHPANIASQRVAERAGFTKTGIRRHDPPLRGGRTESFFYEWWA